MKDKDKHIFDEPKEKDVPWIVVLILVLIGFLGFLSLVVYYINTIL